MWPRRIVTTLAILCVCGGIGFSQDFVEARNGMLYLSGIPFSFVGANAYYFQQLAALGKQAELQEVFAGAKSIGLKCIRTWGFFDSPDSLNPAVIQYKPGRYNEHAMRALDYVLAQADLYKIKLIIPFVNNWEDFGGMNQYVRWYAETHPGVASSAASQSQQQIQEEKRSVVAGAGNRLYHIQVSGGYTHDDFYRIEEIKSWYKAYVAMLLSRINTYNGRRYKDDPTILSWELANEPRSSDRTGELVRSWISEMSSFVKSLDHNHLLATGEEGFDVSQAGFRAPTEYNNQAWLFDGTAGVSFTKNSQDPNIDLAGFHLYADAWNLSATAGGQWIQEHANLSKKLGKPSVLGEFGIQMSRSLVYEGWLNALLHSPSSGGLVWQLVYKGGEDLDRYALSCSSEPLVCNVLASYGLELSKRDRDSMIIPAVSSLQQNYPNPFNRATVIRYELNAPNHVRLEVFNTLGELVATLFNGWESSGKYAKVFEVRGLTNRASPNGPNATGVYFYRLTAAGFTETKKMLLLR